jgi:GNAT superfamily N-acetyltransferase
VTPDELLRIYDDEVRGVFPRRLPPGWTGDQDGPLTRCLTGREGFAMLTSSAEDLSDAELQALVDRTVTFYRNAGTWFEWKILDHDRSDLPPLLVAAGAETEPHEALVLGEAGPLAAEVALPDGVEIRQVSERADLERIAAMESEVWGEDWAWMADDLESRLRAAEPIHVFAAVDTRAGDRVVSAAWLAPMAGTRVAGLWGGSTLAAYRGRGIYRALVATRARRALELGYELVQVDASDDSRPILERLGLHVIGGTQPYILGK